MMRGFQLSAFFNQNGGWIYYEGEKVRQREYLQRNGWVGIQYNLTCQLISTHHMHTPGEIIKKFQPKEPINITPQQRNNVNAFLSKLEVGDLCFMDIMEYGLALFGETKAGKTTLAHYLINNPLVGTKDLCYQLRGGSRFLEAIIGQSPISQTEIPNEVTKKLESAKEKGVQIHILDCPGYSDTKGCHMVIANGYFHYRIFSKVRNLKFVITIDSDHMSGVYDKPSNTLVEFLMSFKNLKQIKKEIFEGTSFVFTKLNKSAQSEEEIKGNIVSKLVNLRNCGSLSNTEFREELRELIDLVIEKKRFFYFQKAVENTYASQSNKLLQQINDSTSFWVRNINLDDNEADMSNIQMTLGNRCREIAEVNKKFKEDFQALTELFKERFQRAFLSIYESQCSLQRITVQFLINSLLGKAKQKSFYQDHILKFILTFNIYRTNEFNSKVEYEKKRQNKKEVLMKVEHTKIDSLQIENIQKLEICKMIIEMTQNKEYSIAGQNNEDKRTLETYKKISKSMINILAQLRKIKFFNFMQEKALASKYTQKIEEFIYVVYRLLQQAKTFKIIFETDTKEQLHNNNINSFNLEDVDITRIIFDYIQSLTDQDYDYISMGDKNIFQKCKFTYLVNHFEVAPNGTQHYYHEIKDYFKLQPNELDKHQDLKKAVIQKMDAIIYEELNSIHKKTNKNDKVLTLTEYAKNKLYLLENGTVLSDYEKNVEIYLEAINKLATEIAQIDPKGLEDRKQLQNRLKIAVKLFKTTNNVYKTIQSYNLLSKRYQIQKEAGQLKQILTQFAQYASTHGRIELAIQKYQQAYSLIDWMYNNSQDAFHTLRRKHREEISMKIGMLGVEKRYNPSMGYYDSLLKKKLFTIVDSGVFDEIRKNFTKKK